MKNEERFIQCGLVFLFPQFQIQNPTYLQQAARLRKQLGLSFSADC